MNAPISGRITILRVGQETAEIREVEKGLPIEDLQAVIGGYITPIKFKYQGKMAQMIVDEEGDLKGSPVNYRATQILQACSGKLINKIRGTAVILEGKARLT